MICILENVPRILYQVICTVMTSTWMFPNPSNTTFERPDLKYTYSIQNVQVLHANLFGRRSEQDLSFTTHFRIAAWRRAICNCEGHLSIKFKVRKCRTSYSRRSTTNKSNKHLGKSNYPHNNIIFYFTSFKFANMFMFFKTSDNC